MFNSETYFRIIGETLEKVEEVLSAKRYEYATEDMLHNFHAAAELKGETPRAALAGMMAKHTVSVYDMCMSANTYSLEQWNEKIIDHINYLLLLRAIVEEESDVG